MKTIFINAKFLCENLTGIGRYAVEISFELKKKIPNVVFVAPKKIVLVEIAKELNVQTFGIFNGAMWEQIELPIFLLKNKNPLLLNFTSTAPVFYKNQINTIHDIISIKHPEWYSKKAALYYKLLLPFVAKNCVKLVTVSDYVKKELFFFFNIKPEKICVVSNGISEIFKNEVVSEKINFEYILAVGSIDPRKNIKKLIEAFLMLKNSTLKLVLVGKEHPTFATTDFAIPIERKKDIIFTGYISDEKLRDYYISAKVFVFPSLEEGFGIPPLEAMSCGCPSIVSNASSIPEVCGDAALYIDPKNTNDIYLKLKTILIDDELRKNIIEKGVIRKNCFSWEISAQKIIKIIKNNS